MKNVFRNSDLNRDGRITMQEFRTYIANTTPENFDIHEMLKTHEPLETKELIEKLNQLDEKTKRRWYNMKINMTENFYAIKNVREHQEFRKLPKY